MIFNFFLQNEEETKQLGEDLALAAKKGDLIALCGDLASGKSTLARSFIQTLAEDDQLDIPSPTFTLSQFYPTRHFPITHSDLYRIKDEQEIDELDFDQAREEGVVLIEWPEKAPIILHQASIIIHLDDQDEGRSVTITSTEEAGERIKHSVSIREFLTKYGYLKARRRLFVHDASSRRYEMITHHNTTKILMDASQIAPANKARLIYSQQVHLAINHDSFIGIGRLLRDRHFVAPEIFAADLDQGLFLIEDLGREGIIDRAGNPIEQRYCASAQMLGELHQQDWPQQTCWPDLTLTLPSYSKEALHAETALLLDYYLPFISHKNTDPHSTICFYQCWDHLFDLILQEETGLVLRDFHSPNILWQEQNKEAQQIGLIDFQDAVLGPIVYDLVSLGQDARITISPQLETTIIANYQKTYQGSFKSLNFAQIYAILGAQRASKILGVFVRLAKQDHKPHYLNHIPRILTYLQRNLENDILSPLKVCYQKMGIV